MLKLNLVEHADEQTPQAHITESTFELKSFLGRDIVEQLLHCNARQMTIMPTRRILIVIGIFVE